MASKVHVHHIQQGCYRDKLNIWPSKYQRWSMGDNELELSMFLGKHDSSVYEFVTILAGSTVNIWRVQIPFNSHDYDCPLLELINGTYINPPRVYMDGFNAIIEWMHVGSTEKKFKFQMERC